MQNTNTTVGERISVVETQIQNFDEKLDELKDDLEDLRKLVDANREHILAEMKSTTAVTTDADRVLNSKINEIEAFKNKWYYIITGAVAVLAFLAGHMKIIESVFK